MFKEITITKEFQEFNCFITLFGQTLGVFKWKKRETNLKFFEFGTSSSLSSEVIMASYALKNEVMRILTPNIANLKK